MPPLFSGFAGWGKTLSEARQVTCETSSLDGDGATDGTDYAQYVGNACIRLAVESPVEAGPFKACSRGNCLDADFAGNFTEGLADQGSITGISGHGKINASLNLSAHVAREV